MGELGFQDADGNEIELQIDEKGREEIAVGCELSPYVKIGDELINSYNKTIYVVKYILADNQKWADGELLNSAKIVIDNQGKEHLVPVNDILFIHTIKGEKRYLEYHLATTKLRGEGTIQEWEERLENQGFCSPYRGYLINIRHVKMVQNTAVLMSNGISLPVSRRKVSQLQQLFANRIIHTLN